MKSFLLLLLAIVSEVAGSAALKASLGFTRLGYSVIVVIGYGLAFYLLALSLKQIPLGTAYAIWSGLGTVATVALGALFFRESLDMGRMIGIALIVLGVIILNLFSSSPVS